MLREQIAFAHEACLRCLSTRFRFLPRLRWRPLPLFLHLSELPFPINYEFIQVNLSPIPTIKHY